MTIFCQLSADMSSYSGSREVSVSEISTLAILYFSIVNKIEDLALPKISMKANCSKVPKSEKIFGPQSAIKMRFNSCNVILRKHFNVGLHKNQ